MQNNNKLVMKYPASWHGDRYREATYLGNGMFGATVLGSVWEELITFSHTDLFYQSQTPDLPDVSGCLGEIREKLLTNKPFEAAEVMKNELIKNNYSPKYALPLPLANLKIKTEALKGFKNYRRVLDMEKAESLITWDDGDKKMFRNCFISRADNVFVLKLGTTNGMKINSNLTFELPNISKVKDRIDMLPKNIEKTITGNTISYSAANSDNTIFGIVAVVTDFDGKLESENDGLALKDFTVATVKIKVFIKGERLDTYKTKSSIDSLKDSYEELLQRHAKLHSAVMNKSALNLYSGDDISNEELLLEAYQGETPSEMVEKMWNFGKYLLICASSERSNPCTLLGLWGVDYLGFWTFNMANENLQMIYWQALSANMPELLMPVFNYMEKLMDDFKTNAKNLYGCRGIYIPAPTMPDSGLIKSLQPHILYWTGAAGWVASHYYDYYLCTLDKDFLRNRAVPFLKEVALFYEDFFTLDEQGFYMTIPSNSPENTPRNFFKGPEGMGGNMETTMNATMDFAIAKEVLTNLISACGILDIESENIIIWKSMLEKIPDYHINEDGALKEWMHEFYDDNYKHRHQSHLYPLFPGNEIHKYDADKTMYNACVVAAKKRLAIGINEQSGWSLVHLANNYARMGESELAMECLDLMTRSIVMNNFVTIHNDYREMGIGVKLERAPVQLDANTGYVAAINEMLMQSYDDKIIILPALPKRWKKGTVSNLLTKQAVNISINWNENKTEISLENNFDEKQLEIIFKDKRENVVLDKNSKIKIVYN
ncbi:MAG: glycoside hydrolase N-terminal domain-containing protein [Clostridia bacterium]